MFINNKKDKLIQLRVTEQQKKVIKELADKENLSITKYLLSLLDIEYKKKFNK